jgi:hypothetical protein
VCRAAETGVSNRKNFVSNGIDTSYSKFKTDTEINLLKNFLQNI